MRKFNFLSRDDRFYLIDAARLMPPVFPKKEKQRIFFQQFRPEFVRHYKARLSSDGFSRFGMHEISHNDVIKEASKYLEKVLVPAFAEKLTTSSVQIVKKMHDAGF